MTTPDEAPYGLRRPTMADAREAMHRVHGDLAAGLWKQVLGSASVTGTESDEASFQRLLQAMTDLDPISRLCAQALRIRVASHYHLSAAHTMTRSLP
jgi:hypothetical protein